VNKFKFLLVATTFCSGVSAADDQLQRQYNWLLGWYTHNSTMTTFDGENWAGVPFTDSVEDVHIL
jgi:hypothetical protein